MSHSSDDGRLPAGLTLVGYDAARRVHQYCDGDGQRWESAPGYTLGELRRVDATPAYFRSARHLDALHASAASTTPMTEFPDTWDPPAGYELEDLPSGKRIAAKLGNYRRHLFSRRARPDSAAPAPSSTSSTRTSMDSARSAAKSTASTSTRGY